MKLKNFVTFHLTLWRPFCEYIVLGFQPKTSSFPLPYQRHSSSADCVKKLIKGSNGSASLLVCTRKKMFGPGLRIFSEWCRKRSSFRVILAHVTWPRAQPLGQSVSLKFALETRFESESFKPLIDFLAFLVQIWVKFQENGEGDLTTSWELTRNGPTGNKEYIKHIHALGKKNIPRSGLRGGQRGQLPRAPHCKGAHVMKFIRFK